ncbi:ankyrin repeat domain-containing protein [Pseudoxanthomonas winnipegensis]|uniref:Ankyrin repeat domain-containing protein n=1 Tax=Pseudoxanthomonas winnipegensis TaxID=2480810 RepID=A0A4Q8M2W8_9GAMM|nr:ankyrin repeat domain-containing protein [Pseudoxanthomonas winnipegensis]TAA41547.1 ankyrin repeat domain-containing protein [Pseudoxanthomonas winnipegensis]
MTYEDDFFQRWFQAGADLTAEFVRKQSILHLAPGYRVPELIQMGADIHYQDKDGRTALFTQDPEGINHLLDAGADVNHKDHEGCTALTNAALNVWVDLSNEECVTLAKRGGLIIRPTEDQEWEETINIVWRDVFQYKLWPLAHILVDQVPLLSLTHDDVDFFCEFADYEYMQFFNVDGVSFMSAGQGAHMEVTKQDGYALAYNIDGQRHALPCTTIEDMAHACLIHSTHCKQFSVNPILKQGQDFIDAQSEAFTETIRVMPLMRIYGIHLDYDNAAESISKAKMLDAVQQQGPVTQQAAPVRARRM